MSEPEATSIVITGVGAVCSLGTTATELWDGLRAGRCAVGPVAELAAAGLLPGHAAHVPGYPELPRAIDEAREERPFTRERAAAFAVWASRQALAHAGIPAGGERAHLPWPRERCALLLGTTLGGYRERAAAIMAQRPVPADMAPWTGYDGPVRAVAGDLEIAGPSRAVSVACCSATVAIGTGAQLITEGRCDAAIVGGVDALSTFVYSGFAALKALSAGASRPFGADRDGLNLGEGACVLVLESAAGARARGVTPLAWLRGYGTAGDANHMTGPHPEGIGAARGMEAALRDAQVSADRVDVINLHGTGTPYNDRMEALAVKRVFGERAGSIPVNSIKPAIGHTMGAAGAFEAALGTLVLREGCMPPTPNTAADAIDPECAVLDAVTGTARQLDAPRVYVTTNSGFGGTNAALVLQRWEGP